MPARGRGLEIVFSQNDGGGMFGGGGRLGVMAGWHFRRLWRQLLRPARKSSSKASQESGSRGATALRCWQLVSATAPDEVAGRGLASPKLRAAALSSARPWRECASFTGRHLLCTVPAAP